MLKPKIPAQADAILRPIAPSFCERLPVFASKVVVCRRDVQGLQVADGWCEPIGCDRGRCGAKFGCHTRNREALHTKTEGPESEGPFSGFSPERVASRHGLPQIQNNGPISLKVTVSGARKIQTAFLQRANGAGNARAIIRICGNHPHCFNWAWPGNETVVDLSNRR